MSENNTKTQLIEAITAPLGFFVLALLIIETFLATVLIAAEIDKADRISGMYLGVMLFIFLTIVVSVLVWFKPDNLTFDKEAHLRDRGKPPFGSDTGTYTSPVDLQPTQPGRP